MSQINTAIGYTGLTVGGVQSYSQFIEQNATVLSITLTAISVFFGVFFLVLNCHIKHRKDKREELQKLAHANLLLQLREREVIAQEKALFNKHE